MRLVDKAAVISLTIVLIISVCLFGCENEEGDETEAKLTPTEVASQDPTSAPVVDTLPVSTTPTIESPTEPP